MIKIEFNANVNAKNKKPSFTYSTHDCCTFEVEVLIVILMRLIQENDKENGKIRDNEIIKDIRMIKKMMKEEERKNGKGRKQNSTKQSKAKI